MTDREMMYSQAEIELIDLATTLEAGAASQCSADAYAAYTEAQALVEENGPGQEELAFYASRAASEKAAGLNCWDNSDPNCACETCISNAIARWE